MKIENFQSQIWVCAPSTNLTCAKGRAEMGENMKNKDRTELFENMPVSSAVRQLIIPTIISSLITIVYNLADTYFVGMLNDPIQTAAVTLVAPLMLAFNAVNNLFGAGTSSMMSRALGRREYDTVRRCAAIGFYFTVFCSALFSLSSILFRTNLLSLLGAEESTMAATNGYMQWTVCCGAVPAILNVVMAYMVRSEGATFHASIGTISGCVLNMILDPVFILPWGLDMGAAGAGLATFLGNSAACCYFFVLLFVRRNKTYVSISPKLFSFDKTILFGIFAVGIPACIQNLLNVTSMTLLNNFSASYGSDVVASMGIAQKINMVPMNMFFGLSQGILPLIGYTYASKNYRRMKETVLYSVRLAVCFVAVVSAGYMIFANHLIRMFMDNEIIVGYGTRFLRAMCLQLPFMCMDFLAVGVFQSTGMGNKALVFAILRKIIFEIPALFILNKVFPLYGLPYAQVTSEFLLSVIAVVVLLKLFRNLEKNPQKEMASAGD